jgi:hypothetical protein
MTPEPSMSFTEQKFFRASGVFSPVRFFKPLSSGKAARSAGARGLDAARRRGFAACAQTDGVRLFFRISA